MAKDLFSRQAAAYAKWRPSYPPELIEYIVSFVRERRLAWDCATGNGQAAVLLAKHMDKVFATDISAGQLTHASPHPKIIYSQGPAEHTGFENDTFDLVTVAQAYHWLMHQVFCAEVHRVCKPGAVVAVWGYGLCGTDRPAVNDSIEYFYKNVTGPYWDEARKYVDEGYQTVFFGFEEIEVKQAFSIKAHWSINDLQGYLSSWSAVQKYIELNGKDPVEEFIQDLKKHWKEEEHLHFEFPLFMRLGRV